MVMESKPLSKIIIAGPSAFETKTQIVICTEFLKKMGVKYFRAPLWKPRSTPGWDGIGFYEMPFLIEETLSQGLIPALEVFSSIQAQMLVDSIKKFGSNGKILVWFGSRNQNHFELKRMVKIFLDSPAEIMFKNQVWYDPKHWFGIYEHITGADFPKNRLLACHRGFSVATPDNPYGSQNAPDYPLAKQMQEKMKIPMIIDASQIAGERDKVFDVLTQSSKYDFDGYMVEVSDNPDNSISGGGVQLTFKEFEVFLQMMNKS